MDKSLKDDLDNYINCFLEQEEVKKYFILEKKVNEDQNIISLQDKIRKAQKALALSINNQEEHQKKLIEYQNLKKEFDENPLVCNYNILKENIYLQLKTLQERIKE